MNRNGPLRNGPLTYQSPWTIRLLRPWAAGPRPSPQSPRWESASEAQFPPDVGTVACVWQSGARTPQAQAPRTQWAPGRGPQWWCCRCRRCRAEPAPSHFRLLPWVHITSGDGVSPLEIWTVSMETFLFPSFKTLGGFSILVLAIKYKKWENMGKVRKRNVVSRVCYIGC